MKKVIIILLLFPLNFFAQDFDFGGGGEYINFKNDQCLTNHDRVIISNEIKENLKLLSNKSVISKENKSVSFIWPLRKDTSLVFNNYFGISNFVDQDTSSLIQDYNCLNRSYDGHKGTDIFTWPFPWYLYSNDYINVIASEAGTIINKHDGHDDDHCPNTMGGTWNAVYIQHNDGSIAWYGHLKKNSLTAKAIGQSVLKGEFLGKVASSGNSTGPHLHLEIYDSAWNLIDPFQGPCNNLNSNSWWANQRNYREPILNALLTHNSKPIHGCPENNEEPNISNNFSFGDTIFFASYYSDRELGDSAQYRIISPNNVVWDSWAQVAASTYNASWYYWKKLLPRNGPFGVWKFEIEFNGQLNVHEFQYGMPLFLDNKNINIKKLIFVTDVIGREVREKKNITQFYIYDDGSVEKKIIIE